MSAKKVEAAPSTVVSCKLIETKRTTKARVIFRAAVAIRKFQRFESDKFKKSLEYNFHKEAAIEELSRLYTEDLTFFLNEFVKLSYFIRKFSLTFEDLSFIASDDGLISSIYQSLQIGLRKLKQEGSNDGFNDGSEDSIKRIAVADRKCLYFLCLSLKHLTRNSKSSFIRLDILQIIELIKSCDSSLVTTEIVALLAHHIEKLPETLNNELCVTLENLVPSLSQLSDEAKAFFLSKMEANRSMKQHFSDIMQRNDDIKVRKTVEVRKVKKNQQIVTKTIQTVKSKQETKQSEETDFKFLNLSDCMRSRTRRLNFNTVTEPETVKGEGGNDRSMFNSTWAETVNLHSLSETQLLKDDDKDNYLPNKFLGNHYYIDNFFKSGHEGKMLYSFFINRMCAAIFLRASRKQQLNNMAIDKLMKCVTSFDSLVSVLGLNQKFVDMFVDRILLRYWDLKKITEPRMLVDFFKNVKDKTTEEYMIEGWFYNSTYVRSKSYDRAEVEEIITREISRVRLDAVNALYENAKRDKAVLTKERVTQIQSCLDSNSERDDDSFKACIFKIIELAETLEDFDYKEVFHSYLRQLNGGSTKNIPAILKFLNNQARLERSQVLFCSKSIEILIKLLGSDSVFTTELKLDVMEIINTYLEHELTRGLSEDNLQLFLCNTLESNESCLRNAALTSLLLLTYKAESLPAKILKMLVTNFDLYTQDSNYILFILSRTICADDAKCFLNDAIDIERISHKLQCDQTVDLNDYSEDGQRVKFEKISEKNRHNSSNQISLLTAKIILKSAENKVRLSTVTIDNLLLAVSSSCEDEKQTKIVAAKCLYCASQHMKFENDNLVQMIELINSVVYDVGVYIQAAYLNGCQTLACGKCPDLIRLENKSSTLIPKKSACEKCLDAVHLESICSLYASESLKLGVHDFEGEINSSFFTTLFYEGRKQRFNDKHLFYLFDSILGSNEKHATRVLDILMVYTIDYSVPETTVKTLENLLSFAQHYEKTLIVLQNLILCGQSLVTSKTLNIFIDHLYLSVNSRLRFYSFKMLEKVSRNQELPDDIFCKFELAKAGFALDRQMEPGNSTEKPMIIEYIGTQTDQGLQLPIDTKLALEKEISDKGVLKIFANVSKNRQIIPLNLLDALIKMFDPTNGYNDCSILLINIFENAAKNNQTLPIGLLDKLEEALHREDLEQSTLSVFIYLAQKGEKLSKFVVDKLLDRLFSETDPVLKQELLSSLGSLIDANREETKLCRTTITRILTREMKCDNFNIQKLCITAVGKLATVTKQLEEELLDELLHVGTDLNTNKMIRSEISLLFDLLDVEYNPFVLEKFCRDRIKVANLSYNSSRNLLDQLNGFANLEFGFFEQNYKQLKKIIDNENSEQQEEALKILLKSKVKSRISNELLESIAVLYESTVSVNLMSSCLQLFEDAAESGKTLEGRAYDIWNEKKNREENVNKFFQSQVYQELKHDFQLGDAVITDLLKLIQVSEKISGIDNLADLVELIVRENSLCYESKSFVLLIEQCLLRKRIIETALPCYCRIIRERKYCQVEDCLQILTKHFTESVEDTEISVAVLTHFFDAMYCARKSVRLSDECIMLLEDNLDSSNEIIRGYSFRILRATSTDPNYVKSSRFNDWCDEVIANLCLNANVKIEKSKDYLDFLEIIASVGFLDVAVFKNNPRETWKRELMISSLFATYKVHQLVQVQFYTNWFSVEEKFRYQKSCKILSAIQMANFESVAQIVDLISIMADNLIPFDEILQILSIYESAPYHVFKQAWCMEKMRACVPKKDDINGTYLKKLVEKFCARFGANFINKMLCSIKSLDNLRAFEDLIDFCSREDIDLEDMVLDNIELSELRCLIEAKHLSNRVKCRPRSDDEEKRLMKIMQTLLNEGYNFDQLRQIVDAFKLPRFQDLVHILSTIHTYNLSASSYLAKCTRILSETKTFTDSIRKFHKLAIENHFQLEGKIKDLGELLAELKKYNPALKVDPGSLDIKKNIFEAQSDKFNWNEMQINLWAKDIMEHSPRKTFSDYEAIAVIMRANFIVTEQTLTYTQILCSLIALQDKENVKGKLLQVATGEGKSTIVCILAIVNCLRGKQVDVITSSPVLAERDAKHKAKLFRMFKLTCSDNNDKTVYLKGVKDCYKADIVYGEVSQFQFDILRDNYSKLGTLGGRKCETAIVDEVDSMLIDDSSKIARLSATVPGMDHFQPIYVFLWQRLVSIQEKFITFNGNMYFIDGKVDFEHGKITLEIPDESGCIEKISDLESYLLSTSDISRVGEMVGDDLDDYLRKSLESYLDSQIKTNQIYISSNFTEFFEKQKTKWIFNAIEALNYQENVHYVIQDGQIKPVDYYSTGIVQSSTNWSDGLHQFLQLKHNLRMTSETLTTNFLSNIGFINKYDRVYGLTGTLGSEKAREVLKNVYTVELINVPQRRQKQYLELEPIVVQGESEWLNEIMSDVYLEVKKERGILIICETIENANRIKETLIKKESGPRAVKLYTMNDTNQEKNVERIFPGEVIIATNLAGRGTDIQTDGIEVTGGLHVILTFLPSNQRVEDQAFGRTARQGKRGTGLMILNANNLIGFTNATTNKVTKEQRDEIESQQLKLFEEHELKLIQTKDKLFDRFCTFLNDVIRRAIRAKGTSCIKTTLVNWATDVQPTVYEHNVLSAVEEQWAMFLRRLDDGDIPCEDAEVKCTALIEQLRTDFNNETLIKNSYYFTCIAYDIIVNEWSVSDSSKAQRALGYFRKAIELQEKRMNKERDQKSSTNMMEIIGDSAFPTESNKKASKLDDSMTASETQSYGSGSAHFGVAWCLLLLKEENYKENALMSLKAARQCLSNEMSLLNTTQILLEQKQRGFVNSGLYQQLNVKATILGSYLNAVQSCIDAINRSLRLIDVVATQNHEKGSVLETIKFFKEQQRDESKKHAFKSSDVKLRDEEIYSLTFNHLTWREDSGTIDQALGTLNNAFEEKKTEQSGIRSKWTKAMKRENTCGLDKNSYCDIRICLKQIDLTRVRSALFNPDKEFTDLIRESAIQKLREERSYTHALDQYLYLPSWADTSSFGVNLTISSNDERKIKKEFKDQQINEAITIINDQPDSDATLRFDIVIKKANENEINRLFTPSNKRSAKLGVGFDNLGQDTVIAKLSSVKATSVDIEFVVSKLILLKLIEENEELNGGILCTSEDNIFEKMQRKELLRRVSELKTDASLCYVKLEDLNFGLTKKIVESCHNSVLFGVSFVDIYDFYCSGLADGQANFYFDKLDHKTSEAIVKVLRTENFEFSLEFQNLSDKNARFVLKNACLEQEKMEIRKRKSLANSYMKGCIPSAELSEFAAKGIEHFIEINEKQFVPWRSVVAVAAIGSCQVIFGAVLIATGFGSTVGMGFVTEGLADIFTAYRAYSNRQFHWSDYCKQKAISLAISAVSMGYSKCKEGLQNAFKGVETVTTGASKEVLEQAGTQVLSNSRTAGQTLIKTSKNLKSLSFKYVGVKAGEAVARECLNSGIQCLSNFSFDLVKPKICESIQSRVRSSFCRPELMSLLRKMHAIDLTTNSKDLHSRIELIVADTINPRHDFARRQWDSIGLPLLKGVLSDSNNFGRNASMTIRIIGTLNGLASILVLTDNVADELLKQLRLADRNSMTITLVLHRSLKMKRENALSIVNKMKKLNIFDESDNFEVSDICEDCEDLKNKIEKFARNWERNKAAVLKDLNVESDSMEDDVKKSIDFVQSFYAHFVKVDLDALSVIIKSVSDLVADQLIKIIDSQLIQPWSTLAVSSFTSSLSERLQHSYLVDKKQNSDSHDKDQKRYDELREKYDLTPEEKTFMDNYGKFRTFAEQINYNAKDQCIAYSQCEMIHNATKETKSSGSLDKKVKQTADDVRNGGPANLGVIITIAKQNGVNVKVVDDIHYERTREEIDKGVEVMCIERGANNQIGHAHYMNSDGQFVDTKSEGFDCVFAAFSQILEKRCITKSIECLRSEAAQQIESNSKNYEKVIDAENWIRTRHPDAANDLLFSAGLYIDKNTKRLIVEEDDMTNLIESKKEGDRGGKIYAQLYKDEVEPGETYSDLKPEEYALHHIIPNHQLEQLINKDLTRDAVEEYINESHIKSPIVNSNLVETRDGPRPAGEPTPTEGGKIIHAAICNNPHNLVRGPAKRGDDPKGNVDRKILDRQDEEYQNAVRPLLITRNSGKLALNVDPKNPGDTLRAFGKVPATTPVKFEKSSDKGNPLYIVEKKPPLQKKGDDQLGPTIRPPPPTYSHPRKDL